jgi:hypothetical protein
MTISCSATVTVFKFEGGVKVIPKMPNKKYDNPTLAFDACDSLLLHQDYTID